jgi:transcriptional regulator of acetoin/glycerol metabolism
MEKEALVHAIRISNDNKNKAARLLGIHRTALYKKMKKLNIPVSTT